MAVTTAGIEACEARGYEAVEELYHGLLTGLVLSTVVRRGPSDAAELVFQVFRKHHEEMFLPGLEKLGLRGLPDAVACAQYHYFSNSLGGVHVEYMYESDQKAWVRYVPPRWIYEGTAICAIPSQVSRAMLRGWHAHNGVTLGNPRLGYVCTKQTVDGQPGLEGYFREYDHELTDSERLRFAPGEDGPDFDPAAAPSLEHAGWPETRMRKAMRNYTMGYIRTILPIAVGLFGPGEGGWLAAFTARLIGMQYYRRTAVLVGVEGDSPEAFADYLVRVNAAQGDDIARDESAGRGASGAAVRQARWRLMEGLPDLSPAVFDAWNELWVGALSVHNRHLRLQVTARLDDGDAANAWRITRMGK